MKRKMDDDDEVMAEIGTKQVQTRLKSDTGEDLPGGSLSLPVDVTVNQLQVICNHLLNQEETLPLAFFINDIEVTGSLEQNLPKDFSISESIVDIVYQPQAVFKVRAVTRCTGSIEGF